MFYDGDLSELRGKSMSGLKSSLSVFVFDSRVAKWRDFFRRQGLQMALLPLIIFLQSCKLTQTSESSEMIQVKSANPHLLEKDSNGIQKLGQSRFLFDPLGSFSLKGLMAGNIMPIKVYGTALLLAEGYPIEKGSAKHVSDIFHKYGFLKSQNIANWKSDSRTPHPQASMLSGNIGVVHGVLEQEILGTHYKVEVANISCAGCHSSVTYNQWGEAQTDRVWIGSANTSLNLDGFLDQVYKGLKIGLKNKKDFVEKIRLAYPEIDSLEEKTIRKQLLDLIEKEINKMSARGTVLPFTNGGPGMANGLAQYKKNSGLMDNIYRRHPHEANFVQIPDLSDRVLKSSFTVDGINGSRIYPRFKEIKAVDNQDQARLLDAGKIVSFFAYLAMGTIAENLKDIVPNAQDIFINFLADYKAPKFPVAHTEETLQQAYRGAAIYQNQCAKCHGEYSGGVITPQLVSFPNKLISLSSVNTDDYRVKNVTEDVIEYTKSSPIGMLSTPRPYEEMSKDLGYVAPILTGVWMTAPYLHNSSVPTLWHLMNPELRPTVFEYGGHDLDFGKVGVKGELDSQGRYMLPTGKKSWAQSYLYDTREPGKSNRGHEKYFLKLSQKEKLDLIEYLKRL